MNKKVILLAVFAVMIVSVVLYASSYYSTLMEMQEKRMNMSGQNTPINLTNGSPVLGSPSALITIVEFGDYQCEMCYHWYHNTRADVIDSYVETGKANLVFMDLPFLGRDSVTAARATYCADDQGKYW